MALRTGDIFTGLDVKVESLARRLRGTIGIAVKILETEVSFFYNEHVEFPAASTIKIHVLLELFDQIRTGKRRLEDLIEIPIANRIGPQWGPTSSGVLKELESVARISLRDAATLTIVVSDNVATNLLIDLLGIDRIRETIRSLGLSHTKLQRKMMDFEAAATGLENVSCPYDMMVTLDRIVKTEILDVDSCRAILDILAKSQDVLGLRRLIPQNVRIEHKTGELNDVCNDVGVVRHPSNPFIICIMTKGVSLVQGWDTVAEVGKIFYDRLNSDS